LIKNSKRGITLVEIIVSSVITVVVIGAASAMLILGMNVFNASTKAAQQQRDVRLVETVLRENLATALSYSFSDSKSGDVQLFYSGDALNMIIKDKSMALDTVESIEITFELRESVCYAKYLISTRDISQGGAVVMNNISDVSSTTLCVLNPSEDKTLNIDMP